MNSLILLTPGVELIPDEYLAVELTSNTLYICIFTNPSAWAGYDTRSIFKRSLIGLNSEFFFS